MKAPALSGNNKRGRFFLMRPENQKVALADGGFEIAKEKARLAGKPCTVTLETISRKFKLKSNQLKNYRANHYSRE